MASVAIPDAKGISPAMCNEFAHVRTRCQRQPGRLPFAEFAEFFGKDRSWTYRLAEKNKIAVIKGYGCALVPASEVTRLSGGPGDHADFISVPSPKPTTVRKTAGKKNGPPPPRRTTRRFFEDLPESYHSTERSVNHLQTHS